MTFLILYLHELISLNETFLMKKIGITLIVDHTNLTLSLGHEHINITIHGISMVSAPDDFRDSLCLAAHGMKLGQIVEITETVDA